LHLPSNGITAGGVSALIRCPWAEKLSTLDLSFNPLGSQGWALLSGQAWPNLGTLVLQRTHGNSGGLRALADLGAPLVELDLQDNQIESDGLADFATGSAFGHVRHFS